MRRLFFSLLLLSFMSSVLLASNDSVQVVINSADWKDVYSGALYSAQLDHRFSFLIADQAGPSLMQRIARIPILLVESDKRSFVPGFAEELRRNGFEVAEVVASTQDNPASLVLGRRLPTKSFAVLDGTFGYNAVSLANFARGEGRWVLFSDQVPAQRLADYLKERQATSVLAFGALKKDVRDALAAFNPDVIDRGDRFSNNVALLERSARAGPVKQLLLTNGDFLEDSLFRSTVPTILIGKENAPSVVASFIRSQNVEYGVLLGRDLASVGRWLKANTPMKNIYVKFSQTFITGQSPTLEMMELSMFPLPGVALNVSLEEIQYNGATQTVEVTFRNLEKTVTYLQGTVDVSVAGRRLKSAEDPVPVVLDGGAFRTLSYSVPVDPASLEGSANLSVFVRGLYGEEAGALDHVVSGQRDGVAVVSFADESHLSFGNLSYDAARHGFSLQLINDGEGKLYFNPFLIVSLAEVNQSLALRLLSLDEGASSDVFFYAPYSEFERAALAGTTVFVRADYGARSGYLLKKAEEARLFVLSSTAAGVDYWLYGLVALAVLIGLYLLGRRGSGGSSGFSARRRFS